MFYSEEKVKQLIKQYLDEDVGTGDHTSLCCLPVNAQGKAQLICKDSGILAGVEAAMWVLQCVDSELQYEVFLKDGAAIKHGDIAFTVTGNQLSILKAERLLLNIMQRMSGIATNTAELSSLIAHTKAKLLDTRKTTPGFRVFEKEAVKIGGGVNHRFGLYDMILLKDNHVDYAGGITNALVAARQYVEDHGYDLKIEIEVRNFEELAEALECDIAFRIMLDNFNPDDLRKAVEIIGNKAETEASGGISTHNIVAYAETGVNYISVGAITHQIRSLDLSLKAVKG